jgi:drug/metabolite transporter (DMT)-like permease
MVWMILSILSSTGLFLLFKVFNKFNVGIFPVIVINYLTCFLAGNIWLGKANLFSTAVWQFNWFWPMASLGIFFISTFYLTGMATKTAGAGPTSVASKMSVVLPALYAVLFLQEKVGFLQYVGMGLSLYSVFLMTPESKGHKTVMGAFRLLLLVFIGSGIVDTGLSVLKHKYRMVDDAVMSTLIFGAAGAIGLVLLAIRPGKHRFTWREFVGGIVLGMCNFISLVALFKAIAFFHGQTAWLFAINNIAVVLCSTVGSMFLFKESHTGKRYIGLGLAALAILLMNLNAFF